MAAAAWISIPNFLHRNSYTFALKKIWNLGWDMAQCEKLAQIGKKIIIIIIIIMERKPDKSNRHSQTTLGMSNKMHLGSHDPRWETFPKPLKQ